MTASRIRRRRVKRPSSTPPGSWSGRHDQKSRDDEHIDGLVGRQVREIARIEGDRPRLDDPARAWKPAAFSQYPRGVPQTGRVMGYSIRTDRYRMVEWAAPAKKFAEYELYDHEKDPGENVNLAKQPEHAETLKQLTTQLHAGWREAKPK